LVLEVLGFLGGAPDAFIWLGKDEIVHFITGEGSDTPAMLAELLGTDRGVFGMSTDLAELV
jgi:hypothetical protein